MQSGGMSIPIFERRATLFSEAIKTVFTGIPWAGFGIPPKRLKIKGQQRKTCNQHMSIQKLIPTIAAALCLVGVPAALAQVNGDEYDNSMLYSPNVNLTSINQNGFTGIVGGQFLTPYYYNVSVNYLGYADPNDVALVDNHTITLWDFSGNVVASAVVQAGTPTLWANGYAWVPISAGTVTLNYNSYYEVGATVVGGVDQWGDLISNTEVDQGNNGQITWNVQNGNWSGTPYGSFVQASTGADNLYGFSRSGIYDYSTSDAGNSNPTYYQSGSDSIYPAPNLGYNIEPVPEPGSVSLAVLGATLLFRPGLKRKMVN